MFVKATELRDIVEIKGRGSFGVAEYSDDFSIVLRTVDVMSADISGSVRIYFGANREQVMTGRRLSPLPSGLIILRPGSFYRIYTTAFIKEVPEDMEARVILGEGIDSILSVVSQPMYPGFSGQVTFMVTPFRKIEIEKNTSLGRLVFIKGCSCGTPLVEERFSYALDGHVGLDDDLLGLTNEIPPLDDEPLSETLPEHAEGLSEGTSVKEEGSNEPVSEEPPVEKAKAPKSGKSGNSVRTKKNENQKKDPVTKDASTLPNKSETSPDNK